MQIRPLIITFVLVVFLIIMGGYFSYTYQKDIIVENRYNELSAIRQLKVKQIVDWRKERIGDAKAILKNPLIMDELEALIFSRSDKSKYKFLRWFEILRTAYNYEGIALMNKDWDLVVSSGELPDKKLLQHHLVEIGNTELKEEIAITDIHRDSLGFIHYSIIIKLMK